jgi:hypothetical protein
MEGKKKPAATIKSEEPAAAAGGSLPQIEWSGASP